MNFKVNVPALDEDNYEEICAGTVKASENVSVCQLSHNANYWGSYPQRRFKNIVWDDTLFKLVTKYNKGMLPYDIILNHSSRFIDEQDWEELREIAKGISNCSKKHVTIGYSGIVRTLEGPPHDSRILIESYYSGRRLNRTSVGVRPDTVMDEYIMLFKERERRMLPPIKGEPKVCL